jgi:RNA polymerase sigma factor (sigma-70 family)
VNGPSDWQRLIAGDPEQVNRCVQRIRTRLVAYGMRLCRSEFDAEDLADDVLERLLPRIPRLAEQACEAAKDPGLALEALGVHIARNLFIDNLRSSSRQEKVPLPDDIPAPSAEEEPLWARFLAEGAGDFLAPALETLPPQLAEVFRMHHLQGLSYGLIAQQLGIPTATVATRIFRARMQLRRVLLRRSLGGGPAPEDPSVHARSYTMGLSTLTVAFQDLARATAEVLVSSDNHELTMGGGVSAALLRAGGETVLIDAAKSAPARVGDVIVTTAGMLPARYIFHAVTVGLEAVNVEAVVESVTRRSLHLLADLGLHSIALPAVGTGVAGFTRQEVARKMAEVITRFLADSGEAYQVTICLHDPFDQGHPISFVDFFEQFAVQASSLGLKSSTTRAPTAPVAADASSGRSRSTESKRRIQELGRLEGARQRLETRLAQLQSSLSVPQKRAIRRQMNEIHERRVALLSAVKRQVPATRVPVFVSYARSDEKLRKQLGNHLSVLQRQGLIGAWHDRMIEPGSDWKQEIAAALERSRIILLLLSADFISSSYCFDVEMQRALELHAAGRALVVPIVLRPVALQELPFAHLQALPRGGRPVTEWPSRDAAFVDIVEGLQDALDLLADRPT